MHLLCQAERRPTEADLCKCGMAPVCALEIQTVEWLLWCAPFLAFYPGKSHLVFLLQPASKTNRKNTPRPYGLLSVRYQHASLLQLRYRSSYSLLSLAFPLQSSRFSSARYTSPSALSESGFSLPCDPPLRPARPCGSDSAIGPSAPHNIRTITTW